MALNSLKTATLLAGLAGPLAAPGVAQAQFFFDTWGRTFDAPVDRPYREGYDRGYREAAPLERGEIRAILARRGYRVDPSIARNRDVYVVNAVDPAGRRLRLVVDAYDATILRRLEAEEPRRVSRDNDDDRWFDGEEPSLPPRSIPRAGPLQGEPRVIPGIGPAPKAKPAPKKPTTARVEPRAPAPKPSAAPEPAPAPAVPPPTAPAPSSPGPAAEAPKPAPEATKPAPEAPKASVEASKPAPEAPKESAAAPKPAESRAAAHAEAQPKSEASPRVIPLYKKPEQNSSSGDADKQAEAAH